MKCSDYVKRSVGVRFYNSLEVWSYYAMNKCVCEVERRSEQDEQFNCALQFSVDRFDLTHGYNFLSFSWVGIARKCTRAYSCQCSEYGSTHGRWTRVDTNAVHRGKYSNLFAFLLETKQRSLRMYSRDGTMRVYYVRKCWVKNREDEATRLVPPADWAASTNSQLKAV